MRGKRTAPETIDTALDDFRSSGLSARAFCCQQGINYHTFLGWRERWSDKMGEPSLQSPTVITFAPTLPENSGREYRIKFSNGALLHIPLQAISIESLIAALRSDA